MAKGGGGGGGMALQDVEALFVANPFAARRFLLPLLALGAVLSVLLTACDMAGLVY